MIPQLANGDFPHPAPTNMAREVYGAQTRHHHFLSDTDQVISRCNMHPRGCPPILIQRPRITQGKKDSRNSDYFRFNVLSTINNTEQLLNSFEHCKYKQQPFTG
jgi:hypothetical protein